MLVNEFPIQYILGDIKVFALLKFLVDAINYHLADSVEPAFCMRALASLNLSPRMWAVYLSPGVEAR